MKVYSDRNNIQVEREELDIELEGKKLNQRQFRVPSRGSVRRREDGERGTSKECRPERTHREQLRGDGAPADLKKTGRQGHEHLCHTSLPVRNGTETLALTELQQQRLQVCENNWVRKIARVTRADRRIMVEFIEETGVRRSLTERLVRSRLQWAEHVERMADGRLPKRAAELREQGRRRRVMPRLRWEDCVMIDVKKTREEGDWKKKTGDRGGWRRIADEAVKMLQATPHP